MSDLPIPPTSGNVPSSQAQPGPASSPVIPASSFGKEKELLPQVETSVIEEVKTDVELSPELEKAGLEKHSETIHLPQDLQNMGVTAHGPAQPVGQQTATIALPLTDDQIELALHQKIWSNIRWLGEWCVRQLHKAHFHLKRIAGRVEREKDK